jgi:hypothetical protein
VVQKRAEVWLEVRIAGRMVWCWRELFSATERLLLWMWF